MAHENSVSFIIDHSRPIWETIYNLNPWLPKNLEEVYKDKSFRTFISYETFDTLISTISGNSIMLNSFIASNSDIESRNFYYLDHDSLPYIFSDTDKSKSKNTDNNPDYIPYSNFPNEIKESSNLLVKVFNREKARSYDPTHNDPLTRCYNPYAEYNNEHTYNHKSQDSLNFKTVYFDLTDPSTEEKEDVVSALNKINLTNSNFKTNFPSIFSSISNKYIYATYTSICLDNTVETYSLDVLNFEPESNYFTKFSKQDLEKMGSINGKTSNPSSRNIYYSFIDASDPYSIPSASFIKTDCNLIPVSHQLCIKDTEAYNMQIFKYELLSSIADLLNNYISHITYSYSYRSYSSFFLSSLSSFNQYFDYNSYSYEDHNSLNFKGIFYSDPSVPCYLNIKDASNVYYLDAYIPVNPLSNIVEAFHKVYNSKALYGAGFNDPVFVGLFKSNSSLMPIDLPIAVIDSEKTFNQNLSKYFVSHLFHLDIPLTFTHGAIKSIIHRQNELQQKSIDLSLFDFINIYTKNLNAIILDIYYWLKYNTSNRISSLFSLDTDLKRRLIAIENKIKMKKYSKTKEAQFYLDLVSSYSFLRKNDSLFCRENETLTADIFSQKIDYIFGPQKQCSDSDSFNTSEESLTVLSLIELFILTVENENFRQFFFITVTSPEQIVHLGKWTKNNQDFIKKICAFLHIYKVEVKDIASYIDKLAYLYIQIAKSIEIANESPFQILFPPEIFDKNKNNRSLSLSIPNFYNQVSSYGSTLEYKEIFFLIDFYNKLQELYLISDQTEFNKQIALYFPDLVDTMSNRSNLEIYLNKVLGSIAAYSPARQLLLDRKTNKDYLFSHFLPEHEAFYSIERQVNINGINIVNRPPINRCWTLYSIYKQSKLKSYAHTNSSCFKDLSEKQLKSIEKYSNNYYNISEIFNLEETHSFLSLYSSLYNQIDSLTFPKLELKKIKSTYGNSNLESYNTNLFTLLYCLCQFNPYLVSEYLTNFKVGFTKYNSQILICLNSEDFNNFVSYDKQICDSDNFNEKANFLNNFFNLLNNLFIIESSGKKISVFNEIFDFKNRSKLKHKSFYSLITNRSWFEFSENLNILLDLTLNFNTSLSLQIYNESQLESIDVLTVEVSEFTPENFLNFFDEKDANLFLFKRNKQNFYFSNFFNLPYQEYESLINFFFAIDKATASIWQTNLLGNLNLTIEPISTLYQLTNLMTGKAIFDSKLNLDFKPCALFQTMDSIVSKHEVNIASKATNELHFLYFSSIFKNKSIDSISLFNYYEDIFNFGTKEDYKNGYIQSTRDLKRSNSLQTLLDITFDSSSFFLTNPTFLSTSIEVEIYDCIDSSFYNDEHYNYKIEEKSNGKLLNKTFYENINYSSFKNKNLNAYFDSKSFYDSSFMDKFSNNKEKYKANFVLQANNFANAYDDINGVYISDSLDSHESISNNTVRFLNKFSIFLWMLISPVVPEKRKTIDSKVFGDSSSAVFPFCSTPFASYINYSFLNFTYSSLENITFSIENKDEAICSIIEVINYFKFASLFLHIVKDDKFLYTLFSCRNDSVFNSSNMSYLISSYRQYIEFKIQNLDRVEYLTKANGINVRFYNEETQSFIGIKISFLRHLIKTIINDPYTPIDYAQIKLLLY